MTPMLTVRSLLDESSGLRLVLLAGEAGLSRRITNQRIQKPGLALAGFVRQVHPERVQILGATEIAYLETLSEDVARPSVEAFFSLNPACVVVTKGLEIPALLREAADRLGVPLLRTPLMSSVAIDQIQKYLELQLAPTASIHAVLMDVLGVGVLLLGNDSRFGVVVNYRNGDRELHELGAVSTNAKQVSSGVMDLFVRCIENKKPPQIDGMEGYRALDVILTAMEAAQQGKTLKIGR